MPIVGLNFGRSTFRAVELDKRKEGLIISNIGTYENPKVNFLSDKREDMDLIAEHIAEFFKEMGFGTSHVVMGLDESQVFMRVMKVPAMSDKELRSAVRYEAEQYIPLPLDQINLSYQRLDPDLTEKDKINVQVVAAKKDVLERYVAIAKKAKLVPYAIEPETLALGRVLGDSADAPLGTIVMDLGFSGSIIVVTYGGAVRFTRSIPVGGDIITKAIQQELNLDVQQAEEYKKVYGMDPMQAEGKIFNVIRPIMDNLILEIKRATVFFTKHNSSANIKRLILTGGTALMPELLTYVAKNVDFEVQLANPLANFQFSQKLEPRRKDLSQDGPMYSTAVGLALREV